MSFFNWLKSIKENTYDGDWDYVKENFIHDFALDATNDEPRSIEYIEHQVMEPLTCPEARVAFVKAINLYFKEKYADMEEW